MQRSPISVRPSYPSRGSQHFERACFAAVRAAVVGMNGPATARALFGDDGEVAALLLQRAATTGASTSAPGWASQLVTTGVSDFLTGLQPESGVATVIAGGTIVSLGPNGALTLPYRLPVSAGSWIGESQAIPVAALNLSYKTLAPHKAGWLIVFSRELAATGAEPIFRNMLRASAAATIDGLYLSAAAGSADASAGLLNGVAAITTSGSAVGDLGLLAKACQGIDGSGQMIFVTSPGTAAELGLRNDIRAGTTILGSVAVPAGRVIGIDPAGIAHAFNPTPTIEASEEALIHMSDTPLDIGTPGTPPVVAAPTQSMYQTAQVVLRTLIELGWVKWRADSVQYIDGVTW